MKYIYTWNQGTNMYDIRLATKDDQILINEATKLLAECKQIHRQIINDANTQYNGDLDRFIDDEAYYCVQLFVRELLMSLLWLIRTLMRLRT